jgi:hydrogenase maturation protein HypF
MKRVSALIAGTVQGVGFRPFAMRTALEAGLSGAVWNSPGGVRVEAQGSAARVDAWLCALVGAGPDPGASLVWSREVPVREAEAATFEIAASDHEGPARSSLPPDLASCAECLAEVCSPGRRHRYPFTSCTRCGPRASIARGPTWDRGSTTMTRFSLCDACVAEYRDPDDRRCHAQTLACPACGPRLWLEVGGAARATGEAALAQATAEILDGKILALKGVGGWQLVVDATNEAAVVALRRRKRRPGKPFAVLFSGIDGAESACVVGDAERRVLSEPSAPIVLCETREPSPLAPSVAPGRRLTGAMLPASPLHALLSADAGRPLVCTSGNLSDAPLVIDDAEARLRLGPLADALLGHDREILRPLDDSVLRPTTRGPVMMRRARGFPQRAFARHEDGPVVLALGAHLKSTVALARDGEVLLSAHGGDLGVPEAVERLERAARELLESHGRRPDLVACDLHPDLASTQLAERLADELHVPLARVPHHAAHVAAVVAEHGLEGPVLGLAWDGTGLGEDGALWGGEAIALDGAASRRVACFRPFPLPGGEAAIREPRRAALGLLFSAELPLEPVASAFSREELSVLGASLERRVNAPLTTSVGRLFDAVAALLGLCQRARFEAEAAMMVEEAAHSLPFESEPYGLAFEGADPCVIDWRPTLKAILRDLERGVDVARISARFHASLAWVAGELARRNGARVVALGGGCFQNARLLASVASSVEASGATVSWPQALPPGDGGLSVGQALVAARRFGHVPSDPG